ncbi:acyltransferase family protein [Streptomyces sp. NPDC093595]|uniref:acyltransferase family protein n=1 Tax=Streptomyces sp. NPDC093595 TaxID=3366045 RepID=UPI0038309428
MTNGYTGGGFFDDRRASGSGDGTGGFFDDRRADRRADRRDDDPYSGGGHDDWPYDRHTADPGVAQPYPAAAPGPDPFAPAEARSASPAPAPYPPYEPYAPYGTEREPAAGHEPAAGPEPEAGPAAGARTAPAPYARYGTAPDPFAAAGPSTATLAAPRTADTGPDAPDAAPAAPKAPGRDRYFDLLRALALFRVVLYHLTGWMWLPLVFPSMGVMFALAGNLMARSLKRPPVQVIKSRVRRLLPPLWAAGAIGVTGMLVQGWGPAEGEDALTWWLELLFWVLPLSDPPNAAELAGVPGILPGTWAEPFAGPLWYIRAYLWFVLLSPLFLLALRKQPWLTIAAPLVLMAALNFGYLEAGESVAPILYGIGEFGACWILGMAHQLGVLRRLPAYVIPSVAPFIMGFGMWWAVDHGLSAENQLGNMPFASAFWGLGFVLLLLHFSPSWSEWPRLLRRFDGAITLLNSRAVTVYLWHNVCIAIAVTMWNRLWSLEVMWRDLPWLMNSPWPTLLFSWSLIAYCILMFGWLEDVAAKRRPRLWPSGTAPRSRKGPEK